MQRSPSYIASIPAIDVIYQKLRKFLFNEKAYRLTRARNILTQRAIYTVSQKYPKLVRYLLLKSVQQQLQGKVDMKHFSPHYHPWEQRLCVVPGGDLFKVLREGLASVVTDAIEHFSKYGIQLKWGRHLEADVIVSAMGLQI